MYAAFRDTPDFAGGPNKCCGNLILRVERVDTSQTQFKRLETMNQIFLGVVGRVRRITDVACARGTVAKVLAIIYKE